MRKICAVAACYVAFASSGALADLVLVGTNTIEVGEVKDYAYANAQFTLKNAGDEAVRLERFTSTCPCVKARAEKNELQAGDEVKVVVGILGSGAQPGPFNHGVWVHGSDGSRLKLSMTGTIIPLFTGVPQTTEMLVSEKNEKVFTNRYTIAATESGVSLGDAEVNASKNLSIGLTIVTNAGERVSYEVTAVLSVLGDGRLRGFVRFPVLGKDGDEIKEPEINFSLSTGGRLSVAPRRLVAHTGTPLRLVVSDKKKKLDKDTLKWEPQVPGLDVRCQPSMLGQGLVLTVTLDENAAKALVETGHLTFLYPGYAPVMLPVVSE